MMVGKNTLILNKETIQKAVEYYLNDCVLCELHYVTNVVQKGYEPEITFEVTVTDKAPAASTPPAT